MQRDQAHRTNELLERIAKALEKGNVTKAKELSNENTGLLSAKAILDSVKTITDDYASKHPVDKLQGNDIPLTITNDVPGFEGTLDAIDALTYDKISESDLQLKDDEYFDNNLGTSNKELHELKLHTDEGQSCDDDSVHNDYLNDLITEMNKEQYTEFCQKMSYVNYNLKVVKHSCYELEYEECLDAIKIANLITEDKYTYEHEFDKKGDNSVVEYKEGIINDSDHDIRTTAQHYDAAIEGPYEDLHTKKDCILDYVTNEFGILGARYTDIIKFAYYLGSPNKLKYSNSNRGYYSCAFNTRFGGHLIKGGKDQLVKGINNEGDERYFSLDFVDQATDYYKRIK